MNDKVFFHEFQRKPTKTVLFREHHLKTYDNFENELKSNEKLNGVVYLKAVVKGKFGKAKMGNRSVVENDNFWEKIGNLIALDENIQDIQ